LASAVTTAGYLGWRSKRVVTKQNMAMVLGLPVEHGRVRRAALYSWSNYGRTAASLICLPHLDMADVEARTQDLTEGMTWQECLRLATMPGRGTIITTGHFGSWDLAGALAARYVPIAAVADTFSDPRLNRLLQDHRRAKGVDIIPVSGAAHRVVQELGARRVVAIVADRPVASDRGVAVRFFGHTTYVPAGSAALAVRSGASIMPGYVWYAPNGCYYIRAFPPVFPAVVHTATEKAQEIQRLTQYMLSCQEQVVRQCPTQWFMFRPFWPSATAAPAGDVTRIRAA
jgi:KDO2-lipid IV(A) lauroyltransferase